MTPVRRRVVTAGAVAALVAVTIADVVALVRGTRTADDVWAGAWQMSSGAAFAAAGGAGLARGARRHPAVLLLAGGALLLLAPLTGAVAPGPAGPVLATAAAALVLPLGVTSVPARGRAHRLLRAGDAVLATAGVTCVLAVAAGSTGAATTAALVVGVVTFCSGWVQFELSTGDDRRRVLWLAVGVALAFPAQGFFPTAGDAPPGSVLQTGVALCALSMLLPASAAVALVAPRAVDVRALVGRLVVAVVMVTLAVAAYRGGLAVLALALGEPPGTGWQSLVALGVAAGFHPVLLRVRDAAHELLFGGRGDPVETLSRLGTHLAAGSQPQEWLDTLRAALGVPGVELRADGDLVARSGAAPGGPDRAVVLGLTVGAEHVGDLVVTLLPDRGRLPVATEGVLRLVAGPLAQALHATRLAGQLQASRGRVVAALEEERRRVRRDLHDGLGPTLTGIAYSADAVRNLLHADTGQAERVLLDLRRDAADAIAEVRRIVYGLRPRALDELGLVAAVRQQVGRLRSADGRPLVVDVRAPAHLPDLPAAVEVAAYRVAVEAVTNVARHARVDRADVEFAVEDGGLTVQVRDAGCSPDPWAAGVGLATMRERVEAVGGTLLATGGPDGGTVVARLPLAAGPSV